MMILAWALEQGEGRSRELLHLGFDCHKWGINEETALTLAREISAERHSPPENDDTIIHQIESAYKYAKGEFGAALTAGSESACPIYSIQMQFNYDAVKNKVASDILNMLIKQDGTCSMFEFAKQYLECDHETIKMF